MDKKHIYSSSITSGYFDHVFVFLVRKTREKNYIVELLDIFKYDHIVTTIRRYDMIIDALNSFPNHHCWEKKTVHKESNDWVDYGYTATRLLDPNVNCGHRAVVIASLNPVLTPEMVKTTGLLD